MSLRLRLMRGLMRRGVKPLLARLGHVGGARTGMVLASLLFPLPFGVAARREAGGVPALWIVPQGGAAGPVLVWFHGGAYVTGSAFTHRGMLGRIARAAAAEVVAPDYRLAPEHPFPAAFDDGLAFLQGLGRPMAEVILGGDSAGGGLAAALAAHLCARGDVPAGLVLLSPWADLTLSGASLKTKAGRDPLLPAVAMAPVVEMVRGSHDASDPRLSPVFARWSQAPATLIQVGSTEILLDDSLRLASAFRAAGAAVRQPVSTYGFGHAVQDRIVWPSVLPGAPENTQPGAAEDADCVGMPTSSAACAGVDSRGPSAGVAGVVRKAGQRGAQASVAGPSERDPAGLAGLSGDRGKAGIGGKLIGGQIAGAILAQLSQNLTGAELTCPREAHEDLTILAGRSIVADACGQVENAGDERPENGNQGTNHLALGLGFDGTGKALGCCAQAGEEFVRAASAAVAVLGEEARKTFHAQTRGAVGCRVALEEGQRDGAVDVGEDRGSTGPEAFEQGAQLVGKLQAGGNEVITATYQRTQGADRVRGRGEWPEAVPICAQEIGQQVGIAAIILGPIGAVARARGLDRVRVDGHDRMTGCDQCIDNQPRGSFHSDGQIAGCAVPGEPAFHVAQALLVVARLETVDDRSAATIEDADGMRSAAPVQSNHESHGLIPPFAVTLAPAGRTCGKLIVRRSGGQPTAHQPVARFILPAPAARRVSRRPSNGERPGPSRRDAGSRSLASHTANLPVGRVHQ